MNTHEWTIVFKLFKKYHLWLGNILEYVIACFSYLYGLTFSFLRQDIWQDLREDMKQDQGHYSKVWDS